MGLTTREEELEFNGQQVGEMLATPIGISAAALRRRQK